MFSPSFQLCYCSIHLPPSFFFLIIPSPPRSTLFPYTTLFRSLVCYLELYQHLECQRRCMDGGCQLGTARGRSGLWSPLDPYRSEEHTSELQSRPHLVCRLLLEKKKTTRYRPKQQHTARTDRAD